MIVVDSSALVDYLTGSTTVATRIRRIIREEQVVGPEGLDLECLSVLRGLMLGGKLTEPDAGRAVDLLGALPIRHYPHRPLLWRIWELRHNAWPYDAAYIALAETLDLPLLTIDSKLARIPGIRCALIDPRDPATPHGR